MKGRGATENMGNKKEKKNTLSSRPNKSNACFVENHPFLNFLIYIILKSLQNLFSSKIYFYIIWVILRKISSIRLIIKSL